jgi:hypothetical protein
VGATDIHNCSVCVPDYCHGNGVCHVVNPLLGDVFCDCHFGYLSSDNCNRHWLLIGVMVTLAAVLVVAFVGYLLFR